MLMPLGCLRQVLQGWGAIIRVDSQGMVVGAVYSTPFKHCLVIHDHKAMHVFVQWKKCVWGCVDTCTLEIFTVFLVSVMGLLIP